MYVVARTENPGDIKRPDVLRAMESFQLHMMADPDMGGNSWHAGSC